MLRIRSQQDFGAGVFFVLIGVAGLYFGRHLAYGTALRMGPGFFPTWVGWGILAFGAVIACRGLAFEGPRMEMPVLRPIVTIVASILAFGFLIDKVGLAITTAVATVLAAYARPHAMLKETLAFAVLLGVFATLAFVYVLKQPVPAWWGE
jgi:hypothetical protein